MSGHFYNPEKRTNRSKILNKKAKEHYTSIQTTILRFSKFSHNSHTYGTDRLIALSLFRS